MHASVSGACKYLDGHRVFMGDWRHRPAAAAMIFKSEIPPVRGATFCPQSGSGASRPVTRPPLGRNAAFSTRTLRNLICRKQAGENAACPGQLLKETRTNQDR